MLNERVAHLEKEHAVLQNGSIAKSDRVVIATRCPTEFHRISFAKLVRLWIVIWR